MKRRAPHKQLIEAGREARRILEERKIILPAGQSAVDRIHSMPGAPILPGIPSYIPFPWTINATKRIVYDLGRAWMAEQTNDVTKNNGTEFFKFVLEGMNRPKSVVATMMAKTVAAKEYDQKHLSRNETIDALKKFLIDSFAIAVIVKTHTDVAAFLEWFLHWSDSLIKLWPEHLRGIDAKPKKTNIITDF